MYLLWAFQKSILQSQSGHDFGAMFGRRGDLTKENFKNAQQLSCRGDDYNNRLGSNVNYRNLTNQWDLALNLDPKEAIVDGKFGATFKLINPSIDATGHGLIYRDLANPNNSAVPANITAFLNIEFPAAVNCTGSPNPLPQPTPNPTPTPNLDKAAFVVGVNYPGTVAVTPGQALTKIWRFKNTGTTTWGSGYQLAYFSGNQLGAPNAVNVPFSVAPGQTVDIGVPVQIPASASPGIYRGDWQLRNPGGTYFGDDVWYSLQVPSNQSGGGNAVSSSGYTTDCPTTVSPGQQWVCNVTVTVTSGQLLESRGDMLRFFNGTNYTGFDHVAVTGSVNSNQTYTFRFYNNNPFTAPQNGGTYTNRWKIWANNGWVEPEINLDFTVSVSHHLTHQV